MPPADFRALTRWPCTTCRAGANRKRFVKPRSTRSPPCNRPPTSHEASSPSWNRSPTRRSTPSPACPPLASLSSGSDRVSVPTGSRWCISAGRARASSREPACGPHGCGAPGAAVSTGADEGRVALVHNDAPRVAQVSALTWPPTVSSIMVVPVCHTEQTDFRIEVVNERRAPATEWDLALARIVADRLAQAIIRQIPADSDNAVA